MFFGNILFAYVEQRAAQEVFDRSIPGFLQPIIAPLLGKVELPSRTLLLRNDVPGPYAHDLDRLQIDALEKHLATWDRHADTTEGGGVWNWFVFERRYAWMIELMRTQADDHEIMGA